MLVLTLGACGEKPAGPAQALAIINGKPLTVSEFDLRWSQLPEYARKNGLVVLDYHRAARSPRQEGSTEEIR